MQLSPEKQKKKLTLWGASPRILALDKLRPSFTKLAVQLTEKGINSPSFRWASTIEGALSLLRTEPVDCILYAESSQLLKTLEYGTRFIQNIQAIRTSNPSTPVVVLTEHISEILWEKVLNYSCEVFISSQPWSSPSLYGFMDYSIRNAFIKKEHSRLTAEINQQLVTEKDEADRLLAQQRSIVAEIERVTSEKPTDLRGTSQLEKLSNDACLTNPPVQNRIEKNGELENRYAEILRSYVVIGSENLTQEITNIAQQLFDSGLTVREAFKMHLNLVDQLVSGLGKKSSRQVIARSDILAMELMIHLCDLYRK
jgi:response regulator RpfG family c-di-GMP phosphodiesterase